MKGQYENFRDADEVAWREEIEEFEAQRLADGTTYLCVRRPHGLFYYERPRTATTNGCSPAAATGEDAG